MTVALPAGALYLYSARRTRPSARRLATVAGVPPPTDSPVAGPCRAARFPSAGGELWPRRREHQRPRHGEDRRAHGPGAAGLRTTTTRFSSSSAACRRAALARVPMRGEGSGFIVSADGVILTNAHVVADAHEGHRQAHGPARVRGQGPRLDEKTDVAVLKIDAKNLPVVKLASRDNVQVGEWVVGDRRAVRFRQLGDCGHRQRQRPQPARRHLCAVHPDGRRGQSRQLRRPAVQSRRARSSASTRRSTAARVATRVCRSPSRSTWR